jgi:hypothetical protein
MKHAQWTVAAIVLAAMVFVITFAMNYLGGGHGGGRSSLGGDQELVLTFPVGQIAGPPVMPALPCEEKSKYHYDFWFRNDNDTDLAVGLDRKNCKCASVEVYILPSGGYGGQRPLETALASTLGQNPLTMLINYVSTLVSLQQGIQGHELLQRHERVVVPAGRHGWVRVRWTADRPGFQTAQATMWMGNPETGKTTELEVRARNYEPLRMAADDAFGNRRTDLLTFGTVQAEDLRKRGKEGLTRYIYCWSSTRPRFRLEALSQRLRGTANSDPFEVGTPIPLTSAEVTEQERKNNGPKPAAGQGNPPTGPVLVGYKVPVTLKAVARDGKTPFDIGPFLRAVVLSSPDVDGEPKVVLVRGRVLGVVSVGIEDEEGYLNFLSFPSSEGRSARTNVVSEVEGLTLDFDRSRTPTFLDARLSGPEKLGATRREWQLHVKVLKGKVLGSFPRRGDPLLEDSAVYLIAKVPGQPPRPIRIAVRGTARQ